MEIKQLIETVLEFTNILTVADVTDVDSVTMISCEKKSTDAIKLVARKLSGYSVELFPSEYVNENVSTYTFEKLEDACTLFKALHFYRDKCVRPYIDNMSDMI